jgi:hypothetical protein
MFSRWIVTNIISARGTVHCHTTHIPRGDQLVICGLTVQTDLSEQVVSCVLGWLCVKCVTTENSDLIASLQSPCWDNE